MKIHPTAQAVINTCVTATALIFGFWPSPRMLALENRVATLSVKSDANDRKTAWLLRTISTHGVAQQYAQRTWVVVNTSSSGNVSVLDDAIPESEQEAKWFRSATATFPSGSKIRFHLSSLNDGMYTHQDQVSYEFTPFDFLQPYVLKPSR